MKLVLNSTSQL